LRLVALALALVLPPASRAPVADRTADTAKYQISLRPSSRLLRLAHIVHHGAPGVMP
jgi:hypothetical protein